MLAPNLIQLTDKMAARWTRMSNVEAQRENRLIDRPESHISALLNLVVLIESVYIVEVMSTSSRLNSDSILSVYNYRDRFRRADQCKGTIWQCNRSEVDGLRRNPGKQNRNFCILI